MPSIKALLFPWTELLRALLRPLLAKMDASLPRIFVPLILVVIAVWMVSVPIHELLHAAGCILSGGVVEELTVQPIYGGAMLSRVFNFVTPGGAYAGQLRGFDTGGSDLCYFVTVSFPFLLTIFLGFPLLASAARSGNPLWHGIGVVHALLPVASIAGDFYEMGSIAATRLFGYLPGSEEASLFRGDDLFLIISRVREAAPSHGALVVTLGIILAILFVTVTLALSLLVARIVVKKTP